MPKAGQKYLNARISASLHRRLKLQAAREDRSMEELIESALRMLLSRVRKEA